MYKIKYVINLIGIGRVLLFLKEGEMFKGLPCFRIVPNNYVNINDSIFSKTKYIEDRNFIVKQINDLINKREDDIMHYFNFLKVQKIMVLMS